MNAVVATRLEKAAVDNGFDLGLGDDGAWLAFSSSQVALKIWLSARDDGFVVALSQRHVADALDHGTPAAGPLPPGAAFARRVPDVGALHHLLRRVFQLSRSLPDAPLVEFERETASLPRTTGAERLLVQRVGQSIFRRGLLDYWQGRCAVTGLAVPELLRASHIKPWAASTDAERLDVYNGLLLAPSLDALFDAGLITFGDDGVVAISSLLSATDARTLGLRGDEVASLSARHAGYMAWHREHVFQSAAPTE